MNAPYHPADTIRAALVHVDAHERDTWVRMAMAIKSELGEAGFALWDDWSQTAKNYQPKAAKSTWKSIKPAGRVTIASLFAEAIQHGYRPEQAYQPPSAAERASIEAERLAAMAAADALTQQQRDEAKAKARQQWDSASPANPEHPYLQAKGITAHGARQVGDMLIIPARLDDEIVSAQYIGKDGRKTFQTGGQIKGTSLLLGTLQHTRTVLLCEGWATGCTLHKATALPVVVAFTAHNLVAVAQRLAAMLPNGVQVLVCGDTDTSQTGQQAALKAAAQFKSRGEVALPSFTPAQIARHQQAHDKAPSDFNDLQQLAGADAVAQQVLAIVSQDKTANMMSSDTATHGPMPRYETREDGVYYIGVKRDKDSGEMIEQPPIWLCDWLELQGCGADENKRQHILMHWKRQGNGESIFLALPNAEIGEREGWSRLRDRGLTITPERAGQTKLAYWLQKGAPRTWHDIVTMSGWQHGAYILPSGEILGTLASPIHFNGDMSKAHAYQPAGTLADWQTNVGALARQNPLLIASIACALAGALLAIIGARDGIGLHLHALTSSGKSTCGDVAASVWGDPVRQLNTWNGTTIGLANEAEASNDRLLYLDEIGSGDARKIAPAIYAMLNGASRLQGAKEGGNRAKRTWLLSLMSSGEVGMSQFLTEGGQTPRGGQEIRLLDIPADSGIHRAFDHLHHLPSGDTFANTLTMSARTYYGTLGRAFALWLMNNRANVSARVNDAQQRMMAMIPTGADPTISRATRKFGILLAAVEMATLAGLTGWSINEAQDGITRTWQRWLAAFGTASRDDTRLIEQAEHVLMSNQYARFVTLPMSDTEPVIHRLMGYKRYESSETLFLLTPGAFKTEVIAGYEARRACEVLHQAGMLERPAGRNGWTVNGGKGIGQVYRMRLRTEAPDNTPSHP